MRVMVTGATGNVGTATMRVLAADERVTSLVGVARRLPRPDHDDPAGADTTWVAADVGRDDLAAHLAGVDVLVHLAWLFSPERHPDVTWEANAVGSARVFAAAEEAGVGAVVHASSVGAYSPGPGRTVDESWPTHSRPGAAYGREKAYVERVLDAVEARDPDRRIVRMRPAFIFQRSAATEQRRIFAGPFVPRRLAVPGRLPVVPLPRDLQFQAVHADDVAEAYRLAVTGDARGAFNLAADPVVDAQVLAEILETRTVEVPRSLARAAVSAGFLAHLVPTDPRLLDLALDLPTLDASRARDELGWTPRRTAVEALREMLFGLAAGAGGTTVPLAPDSPAGRLGEVGTGVGERP
jgi:nucleoside-diphosphate-sugar epimerase